MKDQRNAAALALVVLALAVPLSAPAAEAGVTRRGEAAPALADLRVSFKLDARLSGPTYGGERWLSPPTFKAAPQRGTVATVDVRVRGVDANGQPVEVVPRWTPADPDMVTVSAARQGESTITVRRAGESSLTVASRGISRELVVRAKHAGGAVHVEIARAGAARREGAPAAANRRAKSGAKATPLSAKERKARNSYALGVELGRRLRRAPLDVDGEHVSKGVKDAFDGRKVRLSDGELKAAMTEIRMDSRAREAEARGRLAEENRKHGETFLAANRTRPGVVALESGLQYRVLQAGSGPTPSLGDTVVCHYRGTFVDGTQFDSSIERGRPATFALKRVIKGWSEALQLMPVGSRWQLFIPPSLAYGKRGGPKVGPNATLVFEVELLAIRPRPATDAAAASPTPTSGAIEAP